MMIRARPVPAHLPFVQVTCWCTLGTPCSTGAAFWPVAPRAENSSYKIDYSVLGEVFESESYLFDSNWSGRGDLNARPPAPKAGALPGCATPRHFVLP
jgi:hypothetical protein